VEWSDLKLFLAIARQGTLGAGARSLGLTQPTMGRRLRALFAGPCRHVRAHHERDVVHLQARTSTTVFICEGS